MRHIILEMRLNGCNSIGYSPAESTVFYPATDGLDSNPGTLEAPFATLGRRSRTKMWMWMRTRPSRLISMRDSAAMSRLKMRINPLYVLIARI